LLLLSDELDGAHEPVLTSVMRGSEHLAMFRLHSLLYVTPSEPHTGDRIAGQANSQSAVETVAIVANTARIIDGADLIVQEVGAVSVLIGWVGQRKRK